MAYQIALTVNGTEVSTQFESFILDRHFDILLYKVVGGDGHEHIEHVPGSLNLNSLTLTRRVDTASSVLQSLFQSIVDGHVAQARTTMILSISDTGGTELLRYTVSNAFISGIIASGNRHGGTAPEEQIQITYDEITVIAN